MNVVYFKTNCSFYSSFFFFFGLKLVEEVNLVIYRYIDLHCYYYYCCYYYFYYFIIFYSYSVLEFTPFFLFISSSVHSKLKILFKGEKERQKKKKKEEKRAGVDDRKNDKFHTPSEW